MYKLTVTKLCIQDEILWNSLSPSKWFEDSQQAWQSIFKDITTCGAQAPALLAPLYSKHLFCKTGVFFQFQFYSFIIFHFIFDPWHHIQMKSMSCFLYFYSFAITHEPEPVLGLSLSTVHGRELSSSITSLICLY